MKRPLKFLLVFLLIAAFAMINTASVLPHTHGADTPYHSCWTAHAKHVVISPAEPPMQIGAPVGVVLVAREQTYQLIRSAEFPLQESRGPPVSLVLPR